MRIASGVAASSQTVVALLAALVFLCLPQAAEARTRSFCAGLKTLDCGRHLQPTCTSGSACDDGFSTYSGSPFPIPISCPFPIPDETVSTGCYDVRPDCGDCSAAGQVPCPVEAEPYCTAGCDAGLAPDPLTGLCETPRTAGDDCGPEAPCAPGYTCDPFVGFKCVSHADVDESCADPFVTCAEGLQCTLALVCSHEPALLGESCDATATCGSGLFCQVGTQRCEERRGLGEACGPAAHCLESLNCDPFAGFVCVEPALAGESCLFKSCREDLVCTVAQQCSHSPALVGETCDLFHRCALGSYCDPGPSISGLFNGVCRAYRKPGQSCTPDPESPSGDCTPGSRCNLFIEDDGLSYQCVVDGSGKLIPDSVCSSLYAPALRDDAISLGNALTFGSGGESAGGVGTSQEAGVAYGDDGRYGCYYSQCDGVNIDLGWEVYGVAGLYASFDDVAGYSWTSFEEAQIVNVVNFSTMQIFSRDDALDLTPGAYIGTADALGLGTPSNPSPVAGGVMLCTTTVSEIPLFENDYGVIEPKAVPEPQVWLLRGAAVGVLLALRWVSSRRARDGLRPR